MCLSLHELSLVYPPGAVWEKIPAAAEKMAAFCCRRPCLAGPFFWGGNPKPSLTPTTILKENKAIKNEPFKRGQHLGKIQKQK